MYQRRIILFIISVLLMRGTLVLERVARATPMTQDNLCFPETPQIQHCIIAFRAYWQENGGLPTYPVLR